MLPAGPRAIGIIGAPAQTKSNRSLRPFGGVCCTALIWA